MPATINISEQDILFAETTLLPNGAHFDSERITFIKDLDTLDLHAVPGSGKTTALLAKLLILERYLPLENGKGVLVLSHTNAAVNEIKDKIGSICPKLFSYPNFIGTIQSFVDTFLTKPYFTNKYRSQIQSIDNDIYIRASSDFSNRFLGGFSSSIQNASKQYLRICPPHEIKLSNLNEDTTLSFKGSIISPTKPRARNQRQYNDWTSVEKEQIIKWIREYKFSILKKGILSFDDAYFLAQTYLDQFPSCKALLQRRFRYIFIDEIQDIDNKQNKILEEVFFGNPTTSSYQRIGDYNQAIYNSALVQDDLFTARSKILYLTGSHRLTPLIAKVVTPFGISPVTIDGKKTYSDGSPIAIKPQILTYNDLTIQQVIPRFASLISTLQNDGKIPSSNTCFKAIGWRKVTEEHKIGISSYWPNFISEIGEESVDFPSIEDYLLTSIMANKSFKDVLDKIIGILLKVLRLESIRQPTNYYFTKNTLFSYLRNEHPEKYYELRTKIFHWTSKIIRSNSFNISQAIREYIPIFLHYWDASIINSHSFIHSSRSLPIFRNSSSSLPVDLNTIEINGVKIDVDTIHSVKGQTHTATLYMECFFSQGQGNFESERLANQFKGRPVTTRRPLNVVLQSAKMAYVGFSRPTHLLCVAIHESRFQEKLLGISTDLWDIIAVE